VSNGVEPEAGKVRHTLARSGLPDRFSADSHVVLKIDRYRDSMPIGRRLLLVAVLAAALVAGFAPHGVVSAGSSRAAEVVRTVESPLDGPLHCFDATCGKGAPTVPAPVPGVVLAAVLGGMAIALAVSASARRRRLHAIPLPSGVTDPFFHPPKSS
jgi:hypothetical protein